MTKSKKPTDSGALAPKRYPQADMFVCDPFDAVFKDDRASMGYPFFAITNRPDTKPRYYERNGQSVKVTPGKAGLPTIMDKDILIYCVSELMRAKREGKPISAWVQLNVGDLLKVTNRAGGGRGYELIKAAFTRLRQTDILTTVRSGGYRIEDSFSLLAAWRIVTEDKRSGRMMAVEVRLCDWLYNAVMGNDVLTIHPEYFQLRRPLDRRLYELARQQCGQKAIWQISLEALHEKTGTRAGLRKFRLWIKEVAQYGYLPGYAVDFEPETDIVTFRNRTAAALSDLSDSLKGS